MTRPEGSSNDRKLNVIVLIVIRISSFPSSLDIRHSSFLKRLTIRVVNVFAPNSENHFLGSIAHREKFARRFECNLRGFLNRITVSAATDRRKRQCFDFIFHCKLQRIAVAICKCSRLVMFPAGPDRTDGVNDESSWQTISGRDFSFAGTTTAQGSAVGDLFV